jgi:flagellar hook-basal body complex protein FliE
MIDPANAIMAIGPLLTNQTASPLPISNTNVSFEQLLSRGLEATNNSIAEAESQVRAFTLDSNVPAHQVMFALEQARLSMELMVQVRNRLVEGYQQIMNMQV